VKRFTVVLHASWHGDTGTLDEDFTYSDGSRQRRVWTLRKTAPGRFIGTAPDVIGQAVGEVAGNACAGNTCWPCLSMARSTTSISRTGCS
jgi:hypothetical protein